MLLLLLLIIPIVGILLISTMTSNDYLTVKRIKFIALNTSIINLFISLIVFIFFNLSSNQFQFVQEYHKVNSFDFYLGVDGISNIFCSFNHYYHAYITFINWTSISEM